MGMVANFAPIVNKDPECSQGLTLDLDCPGEGTLYTLNGSSKDAYNDVGREDVTVKEQLMGPYFPGMTLKLEPHSVNVFRIE